MAIFTKCPRCRKEDEGYDWDIDVYQCNSCDAVFCDFDFPGEMQEEKTYGFAGLFPRTVPKYVTLKICPDCRHDVLLVVGVLAKDDD